MAIPRIPRMKKRPRPLLLLVVVLTLAAAALVLFGFLFFSAASSLPTLGSLLFSSSSALRSASGGGGGGGGGGSYGIERRYLYWGGRIDCPGKHCDSCAGLGHQESSLRCALEEALYLQRVFVMPSRMCISSIHNKKGILHSSGDASSEERWEASSCAMDSLYDLNLISKVVPVILDDSKVWHQILATSMKLGKRGVAHVEGVSRSDLKENSMYSNVLLINRTASPLAW